MGVAAGKVAFQGRMCTGPLGIRFYNQTASKDSLEELLWLLLLPLTLRGKVVVVRGMGCVGGV